MSTRPRGRRTPALSLVRPASAGRDGRADGAAGAAAPAPNEIDHAAGFEGGAPLPPELEPVLEQLMLGVPDQTACRRLNMSPRTFSRRVADLLDYLGVETRFQAGVEVVLRGWSASGVTWNVPRTASQARGVPGRARR